MIIWNDEYYYIPVLMETLVQECFAILEDCYSYLLPGSVCSVVSDAYQRLYNNLKYQ